MKDCLFRNRERLLQRQYRLGFGGSTERLRAFYGDPHGIDPWCCGGFNIEYKDQRAACWDSQYPESDEVAHTWSTDGDGRLGVRWKIPRCEDEDTPRFAQCIVALEIRFCAATSSGKVLSAAIKRHCNRPRGRRKGTIALRRGQRVTARRDTGERVGAGGVGCRAARTVRKRDPHKPKVAAIGDAPTEAEDCRRTGQHVILDGIAPKTTGEVLDTIGIVPKLCIHGHCVRIRKAPVSISLESLLVVRAVGQPNGHMQRPIRGEAATALILLRATGQLQGGKE